MSVVVSALMMRHGSGAGIEPPLDWQTLWLWVVPIFEPPTDASGTAWTGSLWFVPAYLWLTMLSRPLLWSFRRWPLRTLSLPVVGLVLACSGAWDPSGGIGEVMVNLAIFSGLWLIGFAYQDGRIGRMPLTRVILVSAAGHGSGRCYHTRTSRRATAGQLDLGSGCSNPAAPIRPHSWVLGATLLDVHGTDCMPESRRHDLLVEFSGVLHLQPAHRRLRRSIAGHPGPPRANRACARHSSAARRPLGLAGDHRQGARHITTGAAGPWTPEGGAASRTPRCQWGGDRHRGHRVGGPYRFGAPGSRTPCGSPGKPAYHLDRRIGRRSTSPGCGGILAELG